MSQGRDDAVLEMIAEKIKAGVALLRPYNAPSFVGAQHVAPWQHRIRWLKSIIMPLIYPAVISPSRP
jgi:hypothetical protein